MGNCEDEDTPSTWIGPICFRKSENHRLRGENCTGLLNKCLMKMRSDSDNYYRDVSIKNRWQHYRNASFEELLILLQESVIIETCPETAMIKNLNKCKDWLAYIRVHRCTGCGKILIRKGYNTIVS
jgi:hypothetical protein